MIANTKKKKGKEKVSTYFFSKTRDLRFHEIKLSVVRETRTITYADIQISTLWNRGNWDKLVRDEAHEVGILFAL